MIRGECGVGRAARQGNFAAGGIDDIARIVIAFDDAPDITDVMEETGDDEVAVVGRCGRLQQSAAFENLVARQGHEHRVFDIVIEGVAVADALQGQTRGKRYDFGEPCV